LFVLAASAVLLLVPLVLGTITISLGLGNWGIYVGVALDAILLSTAAEYIEQKRKPSNAAVEALRRVPRASVLGQLTRPVKPGIHAVAAAVAFYLGCFFAISVLFGIVVFGGWDIYGLVALTIASGGILLGVALSYLTAVLQDPRLAGRRRLFFLCSRVAITAVLISVLGIFVLVMAASGMLNFYDGSESRD
jgi:hypothetical protein